jgi:hypothetical protein
MLSLILVISLFTSSDTILIRGTQNRIFTNDSNLYFQCKTNKNWAVPIIIDKGNISEYAMTATSGDYIHIVWCKDGKVYYKTNQIPITRLNTIRWECNIAISVPELTEPASNLIIYTKDDYIYVYWQTPYESNSAQVEKWQRARWLGNTPFDWEEPQNISPNVIPSFDIPHSSNNRDPIQMKRISFLQLGLTSTADGKLICYDTDHDGLSELIFATGTIYPSNPLRWEVWEYRPMNRYELVFADTGVYPYPPGITTGNFRPFDVGDIDGDSLIDLTGANVTETPDTTYNIVPTQESPNYHSYPESLSWYYRFSYGNFAWSSPVYFTPDLDNDGRKEIICRYYGNTYIFENIANNQNQLVWMSFIPSWSFAFGDFDQDSLKEFVTTNLGAFISVYENTGPDQYEMTYRDTVNIANGSDVFSGNDLDQDGKPEFFVAFADAASDIFYLYMWEAIGNNSYQRTLIDQIQYAVSSTTGRRSKCGDIDGDGIEELVWATPTRLYVYKATGNNQFQQVWQWYQDHGPYECLIVNIYDMNNDGYKEIVVGGSGKTSIFEVEAVRVLSPNGGETFHPDSSEFIRWQTFHPPRCDSLSLFYSIDYGRTYNLITSSLSGNDTSYLWTVPNVSSDSCKIKIIAYGPGWQYDESDGVFSITSTGIMEIAMDFVPAMTLGVRVNPNPAKTKVTICYSLSAEGKISLQLYDISGRLVKTLVNESKQTGIYSVIWNGTNDNNRKIGEGVYFCILKTDEKSLKQKILMVK